MERPGTLPENASLPVHLVAAAVVVEEVEEVEMVQEVVVAAKAATTVANQDTCHVTAPKEGPVVVGAVAEATVHATTAERLVTSRASAPTRWEVAEAVVSVPTQGSATTAMEVDICLVTVLKTERDQTEAAWSVTSVMKWVTLLETVPTPAAVEVVHAMGSDVVEVVVAAVVQRVCAATTATRWDTSHATVQPWRPKWKLAVR